MSSPRANKSKGESSPSNKRNRKSQGFKTYIKKMSDGRIDSDAVRDLNGVAETLVNELAHQARSAAHQGKRKTVGLKDVASAVSIVLPSGLRKAAMDRGNQAVEDFKANEGKKGSKADKAGLIIRPADASKALRGRGSSGLRVNHLAPVHLAGVLEQLLTEVMSLASDAATAAKRKTIQPRDIVLGLSNSDELTRLFDDLDLRIVDGGVVPTKVKGRKSTKTVEGGAVHSKGAVKGEIRRLQKTGDLLMRKAPFARYVKAVANALRGESSRFGGGVNEAMQHLIESDAVDLLRDSLAAMRHAGRKTLSPKDLDLVLLIRGLNLDSAPSDVQELSEDHLQSPGLQRLAQRAGSERISGDAVARLRDVVTGLMMRYLDPTVALANNRGIKTITPELLSEGARAIGVNVPMQSVAPAKRTKSYGKKAPASPKKSPSA